jgi:hypothetical protein
VRGGLDGTYFLFFPVNREGFLTLGVFFWVAAFFLTDRAGFFPVVGGG